MYCKKCGAQIDDDAYVCAYCGAQVRELPNEKQNISQTPPKNPQSVEDSLEELRYRRQQQHIENAQEEEYNRYGYFRQEYVPRRKNNGLAIAGFICSFFSILFGLVFSIIGKRQCEEFGDECGGLATAGIVISSLKIGFIVMVIVLGAAV